MGGVGRGADPKAGAGQEFLEQGADAVVVVDDQQMTFARSSGVIWLQGS
jgi:hypothetical protein